MYIKNLRHERILAMLQSLRQMTVTELTTRLGVSSVTIRKDLSFLEENGLVVRSHGAARLAQDIVSIPSVSSRKSKHFEKKNLIASRALDFIHDGDTVCLDAGSTNVLLAEKLFDLNIRVATNSLQVVNTLAESPTVSIIMIGGSFRKEAGSFIGPISTGALSTLQFDIACVGTTGITPHGEFLAQNVIEGEVKRSILKSAKRRIILSDSSKFNASAFTKFAQADLVDILITDSDFPAAAEFARLGIEVLCV